MQKSVNAVFLWLPRYTVAIFVLALFSPPASSYSLTVVCFTRASLLNPSLFLEGRNGRGLLL